MRIVIGGGGLALEVAELSGAMAMYAPVIREYGGIKILSENEFNIYRHSKSEVYLCAGKPSIKKRMFRECGGARFPALVKGQVRSSATVGRGCLIMPQSYVSSMAELGEFVLINYGATVGHNARIGPYSTISPNATVGGYCQLGECIFVGAGAHIREELNIGSNSVVGMGAIITRDVPANHIAMGNPARAYSFEEWEDVKSCKKGD